jgi:YHS domain-containing protein
MILRAMSRDKATPIGSVPIDEKSQRKSHITGKIYIFINN